tara:strand:- start:624 stop:980 length:357 start_codon:yes stop_codon:yes gene_type:complete
MAKLGILKDENGVISGQLRTLELSLFLTLTKNRGKSSADQPDMLVFAKGADGDNVEIGCAWERMAATTGQHFLSIMVDDPSLPQALNMTAFPLNDQKTEYELTWKRARSQKDGQKQAA